MAIEEQETTVDAKLVTRSSGVVIGIAMVVANLANYGFQIVVGRFLTVAEYGLLTGLMAVITVITVSGSALQTTAARAIATGEHEEGGHFIDGLTRSTLMVCVALIGVSVLISPIASRFFNIGSLPLILLGVFVVPAAVDSIAIGRLQGLQRFTGMALYTTAQAIAKVAVATAVLAVGFRATGLVAGLVLSSTFVAVLGLRATHDAGAIDTHALDPDVRRAFFAYTLFWFILGADVLFARAFFIDTDAGIYGAAAVLGKAVLWVPVVIAQLIFPRLAKNSKDGESVSDLAVRAAAVVAVVVGVSVVALYMMGDLLFTTLYGERYAAAADTAWKIGLAVAPLALLNLLIQHFLARQQGHFLGWMLAVGVVEVLALYLGPKTDNFYAGVLAASGIVLLAVTVPTHAWRRTARTLLRRSA